MSTPTTPSPRADLEKRLLSPTANSSSSKKPKIAETPADTTAAMSASTAVHTTSPVTNPPGLPSLQIKLLSPTARAPTRGSEFAAGYDMYASRDTVVPARGKALVETDVAMAVPAGTYGRIAPRSGLASKNFIDVGAGVIDADYRGQVKILLFNHSETDFAVKEGDRVAQLILERVSDDLKGWRQWLTAG